MSSMTGQTKITAVTLFVTVLGLESLRGASGDLPPQRCIQWTPLACHQQA